MGESRLTAKMKRRLFWRKVFGPPNPFIVDLRAVKLEYRHIYRDRFNGCCGDALNALWNAYHNGHLSERGARTGYQPMWAGKQNRLSPITPKGIDNDGPNRTD